MQKQIKKFFGALLVFSLVFPSVALGAGEFEVVTRIKNITAGDSPDGAVYTMAQAGDELRHLIIVTNHENYERDYAVAVDTPRHLIYAEDSLEMNRNGWQELDNNLENINLHLMPSETAFLRFTTNVSATLPNENLILGLGVNVRNDQEITAESLMKVYIPNFNPEKEIEVEGVSEEVKEEIKQIYQEEKEEIEKTFESDEKTIEAENQVEEVAQPADVVEIDTFNLYIGAVFASLILVFLIHAHVRKK